MRQGKVLRTQSRAAVVEALAKMPDNKITDDGGRAAIKLSEIVNYEGTGKGAFSSLLKSMEADGMIKRIGSLQELNGGPPVPQSKRCYEVKLLVDNLPESYWDLITNEPEPVVAEEYGGGEVEEVVPEPEVKVVEKEPDYTTLAIELLNQVGEILTRDDWHINEEKKQLNTRLEDARLRLNLALEDNNRLRVKNETLDEEVKAMRATIGTLRAEISRLEARLSREGKENERIIRAAVKDRTEREIKRFMEARPREKH